MAANSDFEMITTAEALVALCERLAKHSWITIDTEFLRVDTYRPILCLVQIASSEEAAIIDPIALDDLQPLWDLLMRDEIIKVFHAGGQDLEIIYNATGQLPSNLFDTQIAASVCGFNHQAGYGALIKTVLDIDLPKAFARTDWSRRPLNQDELEYAIGDVTYLRDAYHWLNDKLNSTGRSDWLANEFAALSDPSRYRVDPANAWQKVKGLQRLKPAQRAIGREIAQWREALAQESNRPRGRVLKDDQLLDLAKRAPRDLAALQRMQGFHPGLVKRHGEALLACIEKAEVTDVDRLDHRKPSALSPGQQLLADTLFAIMRQQALEQGISPETIGNKSAVEKLMQGTDGPLSSGWRHEAIGKTLQEVISGERSLKVKDGELAIG
ncbi:MAG: ribonuclease D [Gammaproteobacteria bacterium]|nr:ribonuclease D [Gammaproteobacteria bacterium]